MSTRPSYRASTTHILMITCGRQEEERLQYEEVIKLRDLGADTSTGVPYTEKEILAMVKKGKQQGHIPGVGTYTEAEIDDMLASRDKLLDAAKKEAKRQKQEIDLLKRVVMSDDRFSQLLTQLSSQKEIGEDNKGGDGSKSGGGETGGGEDDQPSEDETSAGMMMRVISIYG
ncbi:hypothetical protein Tco_1037494, partial [Tanacetum coccineum]